MSRRERLINGGQVDAPAEFLLDDDDAIGESCPEATRGRPTDYSLDACAHCDRGIVVPRSDDDMYEFSQLLCPTCYKLAEEKGLCPICWKRLDMHTK